MLIDEPVSAETTANGRPLRLSGPRGQYRVQRVLGEWQVPGAARLYRLQVATPDGIAVAEVVGPAVGGGRPWRLRQVWS